MTLRLQPGPRDDDNRWACCRHCWAGAARPCPVHHARTDCPTWHDQPCPDCQETPR